MRYFFFGFLFLSFSLLLGQNRNTSYEPTLRALYEEGKTQEAWKLMLEYLANPPKPTDTKVILLASEWYMKENKLNEAINLLTLELGNSQEYKQQILIKRADCYMLLAKSAQACADLSEASYIGDANNVTNLQTKLSCTTTQDLELTTGKKLHYTLAKMLNNENSKQLDVTLSEFDIRKNISYEWIIPSFEEKGQASLGAEELLNGMQNARYFEFSEAIFPTNAPQENNDFITSRKLSFWVGLTLFQALNSEKLTLSINNEEHYFIKMGMQKFVISIKGKDTLVECHYIKSDREEEIWVLDNEKNPLIVKMNINGVSSTLTKID